MLGRCGEPIGRTAAAAWLVTALIVLLIPAPAAAGEPVALAAGESCPVGNPYPGDDAAAAEVADWMARGALAADLPGELPVMAALVESGMRNLPEGEADRDSAGYFGMRTSFWDSGAYAGYPDDPRLQLQWFTDQATKVRERWIADGEPDPALDESRWGEWVADVERPAEQYRGRYQLRLAEARELIGEPCAIDSDDATPPALTLKGRTEQRLRRRVAISLTCDEACAAVAKGFLRIPRGERLRLRPASGDYVPGAEKLRLELVLPRRDLRTARKALRKGAAVRAKLRVTASDEAGNATEGRRAVALER